MAIVLRFIHNIRNKEKVKGPLTSFKLESAFLIIIKFVQKENFATDVHLTKSNKPYTRKLSQLDPFFDEDGILRVGGRLKLLDSPYAEKHPILLPNKHHVIYLIIRECHIASMHSSSQGTLSFLRSTF